MQNRDLWGIRGTMSRRIMIVDDDKDALEVYRTRLSHAGFDVEVAESAEQALSRVKKFDPGLIVTDVRMSGMTGLELLSKIREAMEGVYVVVMTGHDDMETAVTAMKSGAFDFLVKPVDPKALQALAERCFRELNEDDEGPDTETEEITLRSGCLLYTSPSPRDLSTSRMPSSA